MYIVSTTLSVYNGQFVPTLREEKNIDYRAIFLVVLGSMLYKPRPVLG